MISVLVIAKVTDAIWFASKTEIEHVLLKQSEALTGAPSTCICQKSRTPRQQMDRRVGSRSMQIHGQRYDI